MWHDVDDEWFACGHPRLPGQRGIRCMYVGRLSLVERHGVLEPGVPACTAEVQPECARTCAVCGRHLCPNHVVLLEAHVVCLGCANEWHWAQYERQLRAENLQAQYQDLLRALDWDSDPPRS